MNISLDRIVAGANVRTVPPSADADNGLLLSIMHSGVLQPILVRPRPNTGLNPPGEEAPIPVNGNGMFEIVLGSRRARCAREAGLTEYPAEIREMTDAEMRAAQMAENIQRAAMHPVDRWTAIKHLVETDKLTIAQAAGALGLSDREVRQAELLGRLNPTLLELCKIEMPTTRWLQVIARAPGKMQVAAAKKHGRVKQDHFGKDYVDWVDIAEACTVRRISRSIAIFDPDTSGLAWDEDLFAEPGSPEQFTTADADGFLERQKVALAQKVDALVASKKRARVAEVDAYGHNITLPKGFKASWPSAPQPRDDDGLPLPAKMGRNEWAFFAITAAGEIMCRFGIDTQAEREAEKKAAEKAKDKAKATATDDQDDAAGEEDAGEEREAPEAEVSGPAELTKEGFKLLDAAKTTALREALVTRDHDPHDLLAMCVMAFAASNVSIYGAGYKPLDDLVAQMLTPAGSLAPELSEERIRSLAAIALSRILAVSSLSSGSGAAAEWIGRLIEAAGYIPPLDTEEFLAQCKSPALRKAAAAAQVKWSGTTGDMRKRLVDNAPGWVPEAAVFGAPTPIAEKEAA